MKNKPKNNKKSYLYIIFLALAFIILLGTGAYAYYQTTITGTISGNISKWSFKANNQTSTFNIDFGSLYPGKSGTYNLELSAEGSDRIVGFNLIFHGPAAAYENGDNKEVYITIDSILHGRTFFIVNNQEIPTSFLIGFWGIILPGEKVTIPIHYNWDYGDIPSVDTKDVLNYLNGANLELPITVIGRQDFEDKDLLGLDGLYLDSDLEATEMFKYGYRHWGTNFHIVYADEPIFIGELIDFEYEGEIMEIPKYAIYPIVKDA